MDPRTPKDIDNDRKRDAILKLFNDGMLNKYDLVDWLLVEISEDTLDEVYEEYCCPEDEDYDPYPNKWEDGESGMPDHFKLANPVSTIPRRD